MRKKDRLEKKQRKRMNRRFALALRKMEQRGTANQMFAESASFIRAMLAKPSFIGQILERVRPIDPPYTPAIIDDTGVVHWTCLVPKGDEDRSTWPRITFCDANRDLEQTACTLLSVEVTCMECIAQEVA